MENVAHWTQQSTADFIYAISSTFVAQIETKMEKDDISRSEIADRVKKSTGRISQILNNPGNLSLRVMVETAGSLGMKVSVIVYDDDDSANNNGPIDPDVFVKCWEQAGRPSNLFEVDESLAYRDMATYAVEVSSSLISAYSMSAEKYLGNFATTPLDCKGVFVSSTMPEVFQIRSPIVSNPTEKILGTQVKLDFLPEVNTLTGMIWQQRPTEENV